LANMCDIIIASEDAFFSDPVGRTMAAAATEVLIHPWVLGSRRAREFLYTGRRLPASEAFDIGLVNKVVPLATLDSAVEEMGAEIAKSKPFALKLIKRSLNRTEDIQGLRASLNAHFDTHQVSHQSSEMKAIWQQGVARTINKANGP
jgi:enoyl-CoA hydratase